MISRPRGVEVGAVYVHAPFCARRCVYCDFAVTVRRQGDLALRESLASLRLASDVIIAESLP